MDQCVWIAFKLFSTNLEFYPYCLCLSVMLSLLGRSAAVRGCVSVPPHFRASPFIQWYTSQQQSLVISEKKDGNVALVTLNRPKKVRPFCCWRCILIFIHIRSHSSSHSNSIALDLITALFHLIILRHYECSYRFVLSLFSHVTSGMHTNSLQSHDSNTTPHSTTHHFTLHATLHHATRHHATLHHATLHHSTPKHTT